MVAVPVRRTVLRYVGYGVLALVMTLYFGFVTFPYEQVKDRVLPLISKALPFSMDVGEIHATPFFGVTASGLALYSLGGNDTQKGAQPVLAIKKLNIRPSLLALLIGRKALKIHGWLYGGEVQGTIGKRGSLLSVAAEFKALSLSNYEQVREKMKIEGILSGDVDLRIPNNNPAGTEGSIDLRISDGSVKDLPIYSFPVPGLTGLSGTSRIKVEKEKAAGAVRESSMGSKATIQEFSLGSKEATLSLTGDVRLSQSLLQSRLNIKGSLKLLGTFASQYDSLLQGLLRSKNKDGSYPFSLMGTLGQPRFGV